MSLVDDVIRKTDAVFQKAHEDKRDVLFEFEVYQLLDHIGLETPRYAYVESADQIDEKILARFKDSLIIKIVSRDISHKKKLGGVRRVKYLDPLFIQFVISQMEQEVLSHFDEMSKPK